MWDINHPDRLKPNLDDLGLFAGNAGTFTVRLAEHCERLAPLLDPAATNDPDKTAFSLLKMLKEPVVDLMAEGYRFPDPQDEEGA